MRYHLAAMKTVTLLMLCAGFARAQCPLSNMSVVLVTTSVRSGLEYWNAVVYTNATEKTITGIKFSTAWMDAVRDVHANILLSVSDSKVKPGATKTFTYAKWENVVEKSWLAAPLKVVFDDGTTWERGAADTTCFAQWVNRKAAPSAKLTEIPKELLR